MAGAVAALLGGVDGPTTAIRISVQWMLPMSGGPMGDKSPKDAEKRKKKAAAQKAAKVAPPVSPRPEIVVKPAKGAR